MKFPTWILLGFACALLTSIGCSHGGSDMVNPPVGDDTCSNPPGQHNRFVDCGNGTITDTQTHLIWLRNVDCFVAQNWDTAQTTVAGLESGDCGLTDNSVAGSWRLPTNGEWITVLKSGCNPSLPGVAGDGCYTNGPWASGVLPTTYWSSFEDGPSLAWNVYLANGAVGFAGKSVLCNVWPVRTGR